MPENTPSPPYVLFSPRKASGLKINPIAVEQGIELVEGECRRSSGTDEEQVALGEARLNGRHIERLKQLRLEQFADPGDLVARQNRIRIGQKSVGGKVRWIGVDRLPSFHQAELLET